MLRTYENVFNIYCKNASRVAFLNVWGKIVLYLNLLCTRV